MQITVTWPYLSLDVGIFLPTPAGNTAVPDGWILVCGRIDKFFSIYWNIYFSSVMKFLSISL